MHSVSFLSSGNKLCWVGHDSSISITNMTSGKKPIVVKHKFLPYITCQFVTESRIVAAGYDCFPVAWSYDDSDVLTYINNLDQKKGKTTEHLSAMAKFQGLDKRASAGHEEVTLDSIHQKAITQISVYASSGGNTSKFCTSGTDGRLVMWDCKFLQSQITQLRFRA